MHGIGIDVVEIARVGRLIERYGEKFLRRIYTQGERDYALAHRDPVPSLAARFAAKEAALKALGAGMPDGMIWRDFEVVRHQGPPRLVFNGVAAEIAKAWAVGAAHLALSHDGGMATAFVVLERETAGVSASRPTSP